MLGGFNKVEVEHYAEILFMSLLAVYSGEELATIRSKIEDMQTKLLKSINKAKIQTIIEQGLCWANEEN